MIIHTYDEYWNEGYAVAAFPQPHHVHKVIELRGWCIEAYGEPGHRWKDNIQFGEVLFQDKQDLALFLLRWS
jgi:hypothetical protein